MNVSFFSPIYPPTDACHAEKLGCLRFATTLFDFGQRSYKIESVQGDLCLVEIEASNLSWLKVAFQIAMLATVIIPIITLMFTALYRLANSFKVLQDHLSKLPDDILPIIFDQVVCDSPALALTNKKMQQTTPAKNRIIAFALEEALKTAKAMYIKKQAATALCDIARFVIPLDREKGMEIVHLALVRAESIKREAIKSMALDGIIEILTAYDIQRAEHIIEKSQEKYKESLLAIMAAAIVKEDHHKALAIANSLKDFKEKNWSLRKIAITIAKDYMEEALEIVDSLEGYEKYLALQDIAPLLAAENPEKGIKMAKEACAFFANMPPGKWYTIEMVRKVFSKYDREKGLEIANSLEDLEARAEALSFLDIDEALKTANAIREVDVKCCALGRVAPQISLKEPDKASQLIEGIVEKVKPLKANLATEMALISSAKAMAAFDQERALEIVKLIERPFGRAEAYTKILKIFPHKDSEERVKVARLIFNEALSIKVKEGEPMDTGGDFESEQRFNAFLNVVRTLSEVD